MDMIGTVLTEKGEEAMRLIDADKTIGHIKTRLLETALNNCDTVCDASYLYQDCADNRIETWVDEMPTVDAVEVVRCKDCMYGEPNGQYGCKCYHYKLYETHEMSPNGFCSWGERRK